MKKWIIWFIVALIGSGALYIFLHSSIYTSLTGSVEELIELIRSFGLFGPIISIFLMMLQSVLAPIPSFLISGANGAVFGVFWGFVISWIGGMFGALIAYWIAKKLGWRYLQKKASAEQIDQWTTYTRQYGFLAVVAARLVPVVSFDLISYIAGAVGMKLRTFLLATGIGMIPGAYAYTMIGSELMLDSEDHRMLWIVSLGLLALIVAGTVLNRVLLRKHRNETKKNHPAG